MCIQTFKQKKIFYVQTLLEMLQNVKVETEIGSEQYLSIEIAMTNIAKLFLTEDNLSPKMILTHVITGCQAWPANFQRDQQFSLADLVIMKRDIVSVLSPWYDYANGCPSKMVPTAYCIPHKRMDQGRKLRTVGTQTQAFELADWAQFKAFISKDRSQGRY